MHFEFMTSARIVFGAGALAQIGPAARKIGSRALVVTGKDSSRAAGLLKLLDEAGVQVSLHRVGGEPTVDDARAGTIAARRHGAQLVIAVGGGAALDAGKAIAALVTNAGDPLDYLEVVGKGRALGSVPLPCFAVPTTSGTGSEVTRNAVLTSPEHRVKASMRSASMIPRLAVVDPELTLSVPPAVTASTGLDALTQLIEPLVSLRANPMTDALCREGIVRASRSLVRAYDDGGDRVARTDLALASLFGGLALANAGLGAAHGIAAVLGGMLAAPHGALCARLLGPVIAENVHSLRKQSGMEDRLGRFDEVARLLTGDGHATAEDGVAWVRTTCDRLGIPRLAQLGLEAGAIGQVAERSAQASSMKANPVALAPGQLRSILEQAL